MKKLKISFWTRVVVLGCFISDVGDSIVNKALDRLNDIQKADWLRLYNR
jgi:hypothetical protein